MNFFFSADYVLPAIGEAVKNGIVEVTDNGVICGIHTPGNPALSGKTIDKYDGIIVPGFINTHCHLELSHMAGVIPKHTGLVPFLQQVISMRAAEERLVQKAMKAADKQLHEHGIVAVGDHANTAISASIKAESRIHYHTFVEVLGFEPELANQKLADAFIIANQFDKKTTSITAHAPYSVSKELFKLLDDEATKQQMPLSIHNQESEEENRLFRYKNGKFLDFYEALGKDITGFKAQARNSLQTFMPYLSRETPTLLVHNTYTSSKDIFFIERQGRNVTWCFCPNANLYIENALPKIGNFIHYRHKITLGTDSLASNDRLCILSELKTIHQHFPNLPFTETIKWATINGAEFLGIADNYGSLESGKTPGLNLLKHTNGLAITPETEVIRLI
ncbi:amidohydrolase family protein [Parapedobacter koreensis]|uniref:Cytosine/adenosine deaminase n=1 Tax=Parapedobacter koreensis TaxID=332977 RepID=A0A1H7QNT1_9SPHI|nr:amidohydrolase family protein [Parapedobacter koreensis]SEL49593.1 Cytosine/adenosine deaminase [Parapedobacter koreensis]